MLEYCSIWTQEAVFSEAAIAVTCANMKSLAFSLGVSIVSALSLAVTEERCLRNFGKDGIILSRSSGDGFL